MSEEMMRSSFWSVITAPILENKNLTDGAKLFYCEISRRTNERGYCWASNQRLAEDLGLGERTVSRYVSDLEKEGVITIEMVGVKDRKRRYERRIRLAVPTPFNIANFGKVKVAKIGDVKVAKNGEVKVAKNGDLHKENNNSLNNNPPEPPCGGRRVPEPAKWKPERFDAFWAYYRKNVNPANRSAARKAWDKLKPDDEMIDDIAKALVTRLRTDAEWSRNIGKPHASTYLNGQQWLDTGPTTPAAQAPRQDPSERKEAFGVWT